MFGKFILWNISRLRKSGQTGTSVPEPLTAALHPLWHRDPEGHRAAWGSSSSDREQCLGQGSEDSSWHMDSALLGNAQRKWDLHTESVGVGSRFWGLSPGSDVCYQRSPELCEHL